MVTPAPLSILSLTTTIAPSTTTTKETKSTAIESPLSSPKQSPHDSDGNSTRTMSNFRIPKIAKSNVDISTPTSNPFPSSSIQVSNANSSSKQSVNDDSNSQPGKRKLSLEQYKEHKRAKSTDSTLDYAGDVDMRISPNETSKNSPPPVLESISPKSNDLRRDVIFKSNLTEPGVKKLIKKKLIWADEQNQPLVQTSFFDVDESEMVDMHAFARQCAANISIAQLEKLMERDLCQRRNIQSVEIDDRQKLPALPKLIRILLPETIPMPVVKSQERNEQEEREKTVLQALLMRSFLPHSPGEPDGDLHGQISKERNEPKTIPLDDNNPSTKVSQEPSVSETDSSSNNVPTTTNVVTAPSLSSLAFEKMSPEVAQIIAQAKEKSTAAIANTPPPTTFTTPISQSRPMPTINPTQTSIANLPMLSSLLSILMNNSSATSNPPLSNPPVNPLVNFPLNFSIPSPSTLPFNPAAAAAALSLLSSGPASISTNPTFPPVTIDPMKNPPPAGFTPRVDQQRPRFNSNKKDHYAPNIRGNHHGRGYRRGLHNNSTNRRDYPPNRNPNRNTFA